MCSRSKPLWSPTEQVPSSLLWHSGYFPSSNSDTQFQLTRALTSTKKSSSSCLHSWGESSLLRLFPCAWKDPRFSISAFPNPLGHQRLQRLPQPPHLHMLCPVPKDVRIYALHQLFLAFTYPSHWMRNSLGTRSWPSDCITFAIFLEVAFVSCACCQNKLSKRTWVFSLSVGKFGKGTEWQVASSPLPCKDNMDALI